MGSTLTLIPSGRSWRKVLPIPYQSPAIVMELMTGGTAEDLVKKEAVFLSSNWPSVVRIIFMSTARALSVVHRENYVHLDVKPRNIFSVNRQGTLVEKF